MERAHFKGADRPVDRAGWWDAVVYCERLWDLKLLGDELQRLAISVANGSGVGTCVPGGERDEHGVHPG